jgi:hypothetical protein
MMIATRNGRPATIVRLGIYDCELYHYRSSGSCTLLERAVADPTRTCPQLEYQTYRHAGKKGLARAFYVFRFHCYCSLATEVS